MKGSCNNYYALRYVGGDQPGGGMRLKQFVPSRASIYVEFNLFGYNIRIYEGSPIQIPKHGILFIFTYYYIYIFKNNIITVFLLLKLVFIRFSSCL